MVQYNAAPPEDLVELFPDEARTLIAELHRLHAKNADLADLRRQIGRGARGGFDGLMEQARSKDAELFARAARSGEDLSKVGTPNVAQLMALDAQLKQQETAFDAALSSASADLQRVIKSTADEIRANLGAALVESVDRYEDAVAQLEHERRRMAQIRAAFDFVDTSIRVRGDRGITYVADAGEDLDGGGSWRISFGEAVRGMRNEAAQARDLARDRTPR